MSLRVTILPPPPLEELRSMLRFSFVVRLRRGYGESRIDGADEAESFSFVELVALLSSCCESMAPDDESRFGARDGSCWVSKDSPATGGIKLIALTWSGSCRDSGITMDSFAKILKKLSRSRLCEKSGIALKSSSKITSLSLDFPTDCFPEPVCFLRERLTNENAFENIRV